MPNIHYTPLRIQNSTLQIPPPPPVEPQILIQEEVVPLVSETKHGNGMFMFMILILIVTLLGASAGLAFYLYKNSSARSRSTPLVQYAPDISPTANLAITLSPTLQPVSPSAATANISTTPTLAMTSKAALPTSTPPATPLRPDDLTELLTELDEAIIEADKDATTFDESQLNTVLQ